MEYKKKTSYSMFIGNFFGRVEKDIHGWIDAEEFKPPIMLRYELVMLKSESGKMQPGWWDGTKWDYCPRKIRGKIVKWRVLRNGERV